MPRKWEYTVTTLSPTGKDSPVAGSDDYSEWLNARDAEGWEFVGYLPRYWRDRDIPQQFYVFRRPFKPQE